jgi:hypothetical protein
MCVGTASPHTHTHLYIKACAALLPTKRQLRTIKPQRRRVKMLFDRVSTCGGRPLAALTARHAQRAEQRGRRRVAAELHGAREVGGSRGPLAQLHPHL